MRRLHPLWSYTVMHLNDAQRTQAEHLHEEVGRYRDLFLEEPALQNVLLEEAREPLKHLWDVYDQTFHRTNIALQLMYVDHVMTLVTHPQLTAVEHPFDLSYQGSPTMIRQGNYDHDKIESLQRQWLESGVAETVRAFRKGLEEAFDEYNLKFILNKIQFLLLPADIGEDDRYTQEIRHLKKTIPWQCFNALDSGYYMRANSLAKGIQPLWKQLSIDDYGLFFIIKPDELQREVVRIYRHMPPPVERAVKVKV